MVLELNEVLIEGEQQTLSLMAEEGELTCLTGGTPERLTRWMGAMLGFVVVKHGYISIDGEPLTSRSASAVRRLMAYAPAFLKTQGEVVCYEPPTALDVFRLKANRDMTITKGMLQEEMWRIGSDEADPRVQLLAVAVLLDRPILLADNPPVAVAPYLKGFARKGKIVLVASDKPEFQNMSDRVVEL